MTRGSKMLEGVNLHLVETYEDVRDCLDWLAGLNCTHLGFDCETTGLDKIQDRPRLVQFGDRFQGWSIPVDRWRGLIQEIVSRWSRMGRFVGHNAWFDVHHLANIGITVPAHLVDDTMPLAHIADSTVSIGLKQQSAKHIDPRAAAMQSQLDEVMHSGGYTWRTIPITATGPCAVYWIYGALDPVLTVRLWEHHAPSVLPTAPKAYDLEVAMGNLGDRMETLGVACDREYTQAQRSELHLLHDELTKRGVDEFGVNLGSSAQVVDQLLADKVPLWKRTDQGAWSLDKFALEGIDHPLVRLMQHRAKAEKINSVYLKRFLQYSEYDGRIHPNINTLGFNEQKSGAFGVKTSRMSMSEPNLQQLTRVNESDPLSMIARNCIVASPGHTLVLFDFDQIEMRIMTHLSKDPGLYEAFEADEDFFVTLTRKVYQDDTITKKDPRRNVTKSYGYATIYGSGNDTLATTTKRPLAEIEQLSRDFASSYPHVPALQSAIQQVVRQRYRDEGVGYVISPLTGRRSLCHNMNLAYQSVNHLIQMTAAEIMKTKLLELDAAGLGDYLALVVHDEAIADVPDDEVPDAIATMKDVMNDDTLLSLPLTAGGATAKRWAEKIEL
jgi:DNA polymerase I-like protein with 3'-5' exonuclease and polymerase domains